MATPYDTIVHDEVSSTQELAAAAFAGSRRPTLVVANRQSAGRGRSGNVWWQATRGVAASLAFSSGAFDVSEAFPLSVGLAVRAAVADCTNLDVDLKWPNDLERTGQKIGGILVERDEERVVVGCGLNLWWPEAPPAAGALFDIEPDAGLGRAISEAWVERVIMAGGLWDREAYIAACVTIGAEVTWMPGGRGVATGVDERGGLVVADEAGTRTLRSGEVRMVRPS